MIGKKNFSLDMQICMKKVFHLNTRVSYYRKILLLYVQKKMEKISHLKNKKIAINFKWKSRFSYKGWRDFFDDIFILHCDFPLFVSILFFCKFISGMEKFFLWALFSCITWYNFLFGIYFNLFYMILFSIH